MIGPEHHDETPSARDRAVSDLLAFVLVFGIIITSVGVVYIFGLGALGDAQAAQQDRNAERAFSSMGASFNDLQTNRGQERLAELNPRGARMSIDEDDPKISVDGIDELDDQEMGAMHYDNDNTRISYELGAVFRSDNGNSVMVREPEFVCREVNDPDGTRAIVSVVEIDPDGPVAIGSESTMQIGAIQKPDGQELYDHDGDEIRLTIQDSSHADAWERYFDQDDNQWEVTSTGSDPRTAECDDVSDDSVVIRSTEMELSLERGDS